MAKRKKVCRVKKYDASGDLDVIRFTTLLLPSAIEMRLFKTVNYYVKVIDESAVRLRKHGKISKAAIALWTDKREKIFTKLALPKGSQCRSR